jgi:hypothetical protein
MPTHRPAPTPLVPSGTVRWMQAKMPLGTSCNPHPPPVHFSRWRAEPEKLGPSSLSESCRRATSFPAAQNMSDANKLYVELAMRSRVFKHDDKAVHQSLGSARVMRNLGRNGPRWHQLHAGGFSINLQTDLERSASARSSREAALVAQRAGSLSDPCAPVDVAAEEHRLAPYRLLYRPATAAAPSAVGERGDGAGRPASSGGRWGQPRPPRRAQDGSFRVQPPRASRRGGPEAARHVM